MNLCKEGNVDAVQKVSHRSSRSKQHKSHVNAPVGLSTNKMQCKKSVTGQVGLG